MVLTASISLIALSVLHDSCYQIERDTFSVKSGVTKLLVSAGEGNVKSQVCTSESNLKFRRKLLFGELSAD